MTKQELSIFLDQKVQEKVGQGYSITTYAMDVATQNTLRRNLKPNLPAAKPENQSEQQWQTFLQQVKDGTYVPEKDEPAQEAFQYPISGPRWRSESKH
jgi:hypothetical protein